MSKFDIREIEVIIKFFRRNDGGFTPIFGAIVSRNEAAIELLLRHGSRLDIRGSKKDVKDGMVFTPSELAEALGFTLFRQLLDEHDSKGINRIKHELSRLSTTANAAFVQTLSWWTT